MKITNIYLTIALATPMICSCTSEETLDVKQTGNEAISFRASTNNLSRASDSYCNYNLPDAFTVYAKTHEGDKDYILGAKVIGGGNGGYNFESGNQYYWSDEAGSLDFIAYHNYDGTFDDWKTEPKFEDFTVAEDVSQQKDLIYAIANNVSKPETGGNVELNFRHALAQVVFKANVTNPNLQVEISSVGIGNLHGKGTYTIPNDETTDNWTVHEGDVDTPAERDNNWSADATERLKRYSITTSKTLSSTTGVTSLSEAPSDHKNGDWSNVMTLIPQTKDAWNPNTSGDDGVYIKLKCKIYNLDGENLTQLHDGWVFIPVAVDWKEGIRYAYTITFGNGHSGYTGSGDDDEKDDDPEPPTDPEETLVGMDVTISTDDFTVIDYELE